MHLLPSLGVAGMQPDRQNEPGKGGREEERSECQAGGGKADSGSTMRGKSVG